MSTTVRELITRWGFDVDFNKLDKMDKSVDGLKKNIVTTQRRIEETGKYLRSFGTRLTTFVTLPIAGVGAGIIKLASDAQETRSKFNAVFKELSGDVREWANTQAEALGRSKISFEGYLSTLQDTFVPLGASREQAAEFSKTLTLLTIDLASFNNEAESETLRSLQSAIVGNTETVRKYGIIITQATLGQELMNLGLADSVKNATELQKAQARLSLIMKNSKDAQGDAIRTSEEFANQLRALTSAAKDTAVEFGEILIPVALKVVKKLRELTLWVSNLDAATQENIIIFLSLIATLGPLLIGIGFITIAVSSFITALKNLKKAIIFVRTTLLGFQLVAFAIPLLIITIIAAIGLLIEDLIKWKNGNKSVLGEISGDYENFEKKIIGIIDNISEKWESFKNIIDELTPKFEGSSDRAVNSLKNIGRALISNLPFIGNVDSFNPPNNVFTSMGGGAINRNNSNINVNATVNMQVPEGTPEQQVNIIRNEGKNIVRQEFQNILREAQLGFPETE